MKIIVAIFILIIPSLSFATESSAIADSSSNTGVQLVAADITGFPLDHTDSGTWRPVMSLRIGYGRDLIYPIGVRVFAEYYKFDFDNHAGLAYQDYSYGKRFDYAIYPAITMFGFFEFALGICSTSEDEVIHRSVFSPQLRIDPAVKKTNVFMHFGVEKSFSIVGPIILSVGAVLRDYLGQDNMSLGFRIGGRVLI